MGDLGPYGPGGTVAVCFSGAAIHRHCRVRIWRTRAGGRLSVRLHFRAVCQPAVSCGGVQEHTGTCANRRTVLSPRRLSRRLLSCGQIQPEIPAHAGVAGDHSVLDQPSGAHLCVDVSARLARHSECSGDARLCGCTADQHAFCGAARHRLRLFAADDHADLCESGKTRPAPA